MSVLKHYTQVQHATTDDVVSRYGPLVRRIAYHLLARLPPSVQVEDLIQAGMAALLEATRTFDPAQGVPFEGYAGIRVRGGMVDELRRGDWAPRSLHRRERAIVQALTEIQQRPGPPPSDEEVARAAGMGLDEYYAVIRDAASARMLSLQEITADQVDSVPDETTPDPGALAERQDLVQRLAERIRHLPEREQLVIALYYHEGLNLREIGAVLKVTESRVCQIHGQALLRLRAMMTEAPA
jgi:RNA polymerase sigma factor for flagellar operon FliA